MRKASNGAQKGAWRLADFKGYMSVLPTCRPFGNDVLLLIMRQDFARRRRRRRCNFAHDVAREMLTAFVRIVASNIEDQLVSS
jgi:hypothetical protein